MLLRLGCPLLSIHLEVAPLSHSSAAPAVTCSDPYDESTCQRQTAQSVHPSVGVVVMGGQMAAGGAGRMGHLTGPCPQHEAHILAQARHHASSFPAWSESPECSLLGSAVRDLMNLEVRTWEDLQYCHLYNYPSAAAHKHAAYLLLNTVVSSRAAVHH